MPRNSGHSLPPSPRWALVSAFLREGREPIPPVRAEWDQGDYDGYCYTVRNFRLGRDEWAFGKIPPRYLTDYEPRES